MYVPIMDFETTVFINDVILDNALFFLKILIKSVWKNHIVSRGWIGVIEEINLLIIGFYVKNS